MARNRFWIWTAAVALLFAPQTMAGMLIGSTFDSIYDIDPVTGLASNPRATTESFSITFVGDVLYGIQGQRLYTLDAGTGESTLLGTLPVPTTIGAVDLAWDAANDRLLGIFFRPGRSGNSIYAIDPTSLNAQYIRLLDRPYGSLAFLDTGELFALDPLSEVIGLLNPTDFSTTSMSALSSEVALSAIASDGAGELLILDIALDHSSHLAALDPWTGALTPLGSTQTNTEFFSLAYIPEPGSVVLLLFGSVGLLLRRRASCLCPAH